MWITNALVFLLLWEACQARELEEGCVSEFTTSVTPKIIKATEPGILYSPGYETGEVYPDSIQCSYQLHAPKGMHVRLKFNEIDIDATEACNTDSLILFDFNSEGNAVVTSKICGRIQLHDFVSETHAVQLVFRTDAFVGSKGFNISYSSQQSKSVCSSELKQCKNRNCVEVDKVCDGNDDCGDGTDEENCSGVVLTPEECGKPEIDPASANFDRIVGGKEVVPGSWPWMAELQLKVLEPNGHICGGSLINAQWVLTAAHCFMQPITRKADVWRIHLGNHHKFKRDPQEQIRYVERFIIYDDIPPEKFEKDGEFSMSHDVALIKLNAPVKFTSYVKPVCLPDPKTILNIGSNCYATGWGMTRGTGANDVLKQAYHPVQAGVLCQRLVGNQFEPKTMICAGSMAPLNGVCHGDSGGPLVCETKKKQWSIMGVASYVTDTNYINGFCGLKGRPSVFNKIAMKLDWIRKMIDKYT